MELGEHLGPQALGLRLGGTHLCPVRLVDRGADDEGLVAGGDLLANELLGPTPFHGVRTTRVSTGTRPAGISSRTATSRSP